MVDNMMCGGMMMWGMGIMGLLIIVPLLLGCAALVKYLFWGRHGDRPRS